MNTADSEEMAQQLKERGFVATARLQEADIVLMNTCTVREQAEHRADSNIGRLRVWKERDPHRILIVAGCAASRWGDSIRKKYPFIDLVSPATRIDEFPEAVARVLRERWDWGRESSEGFALWAAPRAALGDASAPRDGNGFSAPGSPLAADGELFGTPLTAYVTVMRGCNYACSYCIVPQVRGRELYRPLPDILEEVRRKSAEGRREIMLVGQTVNSYHGRDRERPLDFADVLRAVNAIEGVERIRFMSPHPRHMSPRIIRAMAECPKVARHLHLPVQSGSDRLLAAMRRLYTRDHYLGIVRRLRAEIPGILITTDVIVGYPGETAQDFLATLRLMEEANFNGLFAFKYSPRPGTPAADQADDVPNSVKEERLQRALAHSKLTPLKEVSNA